MYMYIINVFCLYLLLQGHYKVVKFLVEHVTQFPSDADLNRYINTLSDQVHIHVCNHIRYIYMYVTTSGTYTCM